jgi:hypothetical protein
MTNTIQLLGLLILTMSGTGIKVLAPDVRAGHPKHQAFIAFPPGSAVPENWKVESFTIHGSLGAPNVVWSYVLLNGETMTVTNGTSPKPAVPIVLPHLQYDCCPTMTLKQKPKLVARFLIPSGAAQCSIDNGSFETVLSVDSVAPLQIVQKTKSSKPKKLKFKAAATLVIGNFPIGYLDGSLKYDPTEPAHFLAYYGAGDGTGACKKTPKTDRDCGPRQRCVDPAALPIRIPDISSAADINCSNSQYP